MDAEHRTATLHSAAAPYHGPHLGCRASRRPSSAHTCLSNHHPYVNGILPSSSPDPFHLTVMGLGPDPRAEGRVGRALPVPALLVLALLALLALAGPLVRLPGPASAAVPKDLSQLDKPAPLLEVWGAVGQTAFLPCSTTPPPTTTNSKAGPVRQHAPQLVLWYREAVADGGEPVYWADSRVQPLPQARLWSSPSWFGTRARLEVVTDAEVHLVVRSLLDSDRGTYRCRVDFKDAPTRNTRVRLLVAVPPAQLVIKRFSPESGLSPPKPTQPAPPVPDLPPLREGEELDLLCDAVGGWPQPRVVWLLGDAVVDDSWEVTEAAGVVIVTNRLAVPALGRQHLGAQLVCRATSDPQTMVVTERQLVLDLILRPLAIRIVAPERALSAGKTTEFQCRVTGSRPAAHVSWRWGGAAGAAVTAVEGTVQVRELASPEFYRHKDSHVIAETVSVLTLTAEPAYDGRVLECHANNTLLADGHLQDWLRLSVLYPPLMSLRMALPQDLKQDRLGSLGGLVPVAVGSDVVLECFVDARPAAGRVVWTRNGEELRGGEGEVKDAAVAARLALRAVGPQAAGRYACAASNTLGRGRSADLAIAVHSGPACRHPPRLGPRLVAALPGETASLACEVDAVPVPRAFRWTFNESTALPAAAAAADLLPRVLFVTPTGPADFGDYACWPEEDGEGLGWITRGKPCVTRLLRAGPPLPPSHCSMVRLLSAGERAENGDEHPARFGVPSVAAAASVVEPRASLRVHCRAPPPSGLPQRHRLLLYRLGRGPDRGASLAPLLNATLEEGVDPVWELAWTPEPDAAYSVRVITINARGESKPTTLEGGPLRGLEYRTGPPSLGIAACTLGLLGLLLLLAAAALGLRRRARGSPLPSDAPTDAAAVILLGPVEASAEPDVITMHDGASDPGPGPVLRTKTPPSGRRRLQETACRAARPPVDEDAEAATTSGKSSCRTHPTESVPTPRKSREME